MRVPKEHQISVVVCDDHKLVTDAMALMLSSTPDMVLVADPVVRGNDAVEICAKKHPDVCVMDVRLGTKPNGFEATRRIRAVSRNTNVLIVTADATDERVVAAVEAGAVGVVDKSAGLDVVVEAIRTAASGRLLLDVTTLPGILERVSVSRAEQREAHVRLSRLTRREREILGLLRSGVQNDEIARRLFISPRTVETHVQNLLRRLGVHSKLEAVAMASRADAIDDP